MTTGLYKKGMVLGIIGLFIGAGVLPSISGDNSNFGDMIYVDDDNTEGPWEGTQEYPYQYIQDGITFRVNDDYNISTPNYGVYNFSSIKDAVEAASDGYEILVCEGTYSEIVSIGKNGLTLRGVSEDKWGVDYNGSIVRDKNGFFIYGDKTVISNFIFTNCSFSAINIIHANDVEILTNKFHSNQYGIYSIHADRLKIRYNNISHSGLHCIRIESSDSVKILDNHIEDSRHGLELNYCYKPSIQNNHIANIDKYDIWIEGSTGQATISDNNFIRARNDFAIVEAETFWSGNYWNSGKISFHLILGGLRFDNFPGIPIIPSIRFSEREDNCKTGEPHDIPYYC